MSVLEDIELKVPVTLKEALVWMADESTRGVPMAGGTDLMVQWMAGARKPPIRVIDVGHLPELTVIREDQGDIVIGAAVTHYAIRHSPLVRDAAPSLAEACATVGGVQIQSLGTIAGSVANASPAGDLAPSLLVADSSVVLASSKGERTVPANGFWTGYKKTAMRADELIVAFRVPMMPAGWREGWRKLGPRQAQAISKVMASYRGAAAKGRIVDFRVALGSVGPTAVRLPKLEAWIVGQLVNEETIAEAERRAAAEVNPISDIRSTAEYRKWVSGRLVRGFLEELTQPAR